MNGYPAEEGKGNGIRQLSAGEGRGNRIIRLPAGAEIRLEYRDLQKSIA
jgi:hypothetical protein